MSEATYYLLDVDTGQFISSETKEIINPVLTDNRQLALLIKGEQLSLKMFYLYNSVDDTYVSKDSKEGEYIITSGKENAMLFKDNEIDLAWQVALEFAWQQLGQFFVFGE